MNTLSKVGIDCVTLLAEIRWNNRESVLLGGQIQATTAAVRIPQYSSLRDEAHGLYDD